MARKGKLGNVVGVADWSALETLGDLKRFLKWVVHSMRDSTLEPNHASIFAQIGGVMLKTVQASDFENRLARIEQALKTAEVPDGDAGSPTTTH